VSDKHLPLGWLIFAAALLLRLAWVLTCWTANGPSLEFDDERLHWDLARNLIQHGEMVSSDGRYAARMPAYPLFLSVFAGFGDAGILLARLAQAGLGAASAAMAYWLARAALGRAGGLLAGLLVAFDPYAIFFANLLLTEVPFTLLLLGLTACAWRLAAVARPAWGAFAGVAVLGPTAIMLRPPAAGWLFLLWALLLVMRGFSRRAVVQTAAFTGILVVLMLPWGLRNQAALGAWAWLSTNGGVTLYDALGPQANGSSNQTFIHELPELSDLDEVARDRLLRERAWDELRRDPGRAWRLAGVKFLRTWSLVPNVADYREGAVALASAAYTLLVLILAGVGLLRCLARWARPTTIAYHALLWLPVVYFTLVHCLFIGSLRYRVPLMPLLALAAATALLNGRDTPDSSAEQAASADRP
jgi:4-amino-4-deoxy-L-arabinose transferase-like glycosyltransferase